MSTPKRKRLSAAERRELIERAGLEVFAERGYRGAAMDEIARRSGITVPVLYDHFGNKLDLYRRLLEKTRNELLEMWGTTLFGDEPADVRIPRAIDAWAKYVETNRVATRMYFRDVDGDDAAEAIHQEIRDQARIALGVVLGQLIPGRPQEENEMAGEVIRAGLVGLALWWHDHPHVPREKIAAVGLDVLWRGYLSAAGQTIR